MEVICTLPETNRVEQNDAVRKALPDRTARDMQHAFLVKPFLYHAVNLLTRQFNPIAIPALTSPYGYTYARDINDSGIICGWSRDPEFDANNNFVRYNDTAVIWKVIDDNGLPRISDPVVLPALEDGRAQALTECDALGVADVVGGLAPTSNGGFPRANAAVMWRVVLETDGSLTVDPDLRILEFGEAEAFAVNENGAVAGQGKVESNPPKGRVWADGMTSALPDYPARKERGINYPALDLHAAFGVNDAGMIVGSVDYANYPPSFEAVVWPTVTSLPVLLSEFMPDKNAPFARLDQARAINGQGVIVGKGFIDNNFGRFGFLAVPQ